jgi:hypothetical protein
MKKAELSAAATLRHVAGTACSSNGLLKDQEMRGAITA